MRWNTPTGEILLSPLRGKQLGGHQDDDGANDDNDSDSDGGCDEKERSVEITMEADEEEIIHIFRR